MSKISTIYDEIVTFMGTTLPDHTRLPNPYELPENPITYLDKGWGISLLAGENTQRELSCRLSVQRSIMISITRKYFGNDAAAVARASTEKLLLEDQFLVIKEIEKASPFSGSLKAGFVGDGGIEFAFSGDEKPFYAIRSTFEIEYLEDLNT